MKGMGRIFKRGEVYWIAYSHRGKEYRESTNATGTKGETLAGRLLRFSSHGIDRYIRTRQNRMPA